MLEEKTNRNVPEYYPTMYRDGFTPYQILSAVHRKMYQDQMNRQEKADIPTLKIKSVVKIK